MSEPHEHTAVLLCAAEKHTALALSCWSLQLQGLRRLAAQVVAELRVEQCSLWCAEGLKACTFAAEGDRVNVAERARFLVEGETQSIKIKEHLQTSIARKVTQM